MLNEQGRPTQPTFTGNRALTIEEPLLFEAGRTDVSGVDLDEPDDFTPRLGGHARVAPLNLPALSEPETLKNGCQTALNPQVKVGYGLSAIAIRCGHLDQVCANCC